MFSQFFSNHHNTQWMRRIWKLPPRSHTRLLPFINDTLHIKHTLVSRFVKLFQVMYNSENSLVSLIARPGVYYANTITSSNIHFIFQNYDIWISKLDHVGLFTDAVYRKHANSQPDSQREGFMIRELCTMRDDSLELYDNFDREDFDNLIHFISTEWVVYYSLLLTSNGQKIRPRLTAQFVILLYITLIFFHSTPLYAAIQRIVLFVRINYIYNKPFKERDHAFACLTFQVNGQILWHKI